MEAPSEKQLAGWLAEYRRLLVDAEKQGVDPGMAVYLSARAELHVARQQVRSLESQLDHARQRLAVLDEHSQAEVDHQLVTEFRLYELAAELHGVPEDQRYSFDEFSRS